MRFKGKGIVVTGGARGIGRAVIEQMLQEGGSVVIADIDQAEAESTAAELSAAAPDRVVAVETDVTSREDVRRAVETDVTSREDVRRAVETAVSRWGHLDVMVSHAGMADSDPFLELDTGGLEKMLSVNLVGAFLCIQEASLAMKGPGGGAVVVTGSTNAFWMETNMTAHNTSKGGVVALTRSAALDLAPDGIRVNSVAPGLINTRLTRFVVDDPASAADYMAKIPIGRFGEPTDVAQLICFLASDGASWITVTDVTIDGGQNLGTPLSLPDEPFAGLPGAAPRDGEAA